MPEFVPEANPKLLTSARSGSTAGRQGKPVKPVRCQVRCQAGLGCRICDGAGWLAGWADWALGSPVHLALGVSG